ncbi:tandem-95 repeat protein [Chitinimonas koreensis]|uniref:tandem-95 repeat protein n=1 Tax=Chitinimonas koreensis TaxID=356302 RepID=UPI0016542CC0|nr:Ig-like domain-containing protein [Chitinimonas koreensis]QNM98753.1 tandem-95 repeat protein [Chitinimonas koreensis]
MDAANFLDLYENTIKPLTVEEEGNGIGVTELGYGQVESLLPQARQYWLDAGASAALLDQVQIQITNLPTGLAGSSAGKLIQLDSTGAGWGWFVDASADDQSEFEPTEHATEFRAKAGSPAEGKLDLLSVLIHEFGHVLGLEHGEGDDASMSERIEPGLRRLPDPADVAALRAHGPYFDRVGAIVVTAAPSAASVSQVPATAIAAANPQFIDDLLAWATEGKVVADHRSATLVEVGNSQTRLTQSFIVGAQDRYLSFTVANLALDDQAGPDDAFEAALLDATTGASLAGSLGMSHSDALLNIQADGRQRLGQGVTVTVNADGSRTYLIDLQGIAAGTAVNLSFDLIGFGRDAASLGSHATIRDVRLLGAAVTHGDAVMTDEDQAIAIDVRANDQGQLAGFVPELVTGPAHGSVTLAADGTFRYVPATDWSGEDSFSYRLVDGATASNVSTVRIAVTPVNDAPVALDHTVESAEDQVLHGQLPAGTDADGDTSAAVLVDGPAHGELVLNADGSFLYRPNADFNGTDSFSYRLNDGRADSNVATVTLTLAAVNDAPVVQGGQAGLDEDGVVVLDLLAGATDVDGDALSIRIVEGPIHGRLERLADGRYAYTPDADFNGTDTFRYLAGDGETESDAVTFTLHIAAANDAPTARDARYALDEDGFIDLDLLGLGADVDGDALTLSIANGPTHGTLVRLDDGRYRYAPAADFHGEDRFQFLLTDGRLYANLATVTLGVLPVNDPPRAHDAALAVEEDGRLTIDLIALGHDPDGDPLRALIVEQPAHGTLALGDDGRYHYVPDADFHGSDRFSFRLDDGQAQSELATVNLTVVPVNDAPELGDAAYRLDEDDELRLDLAALGRDADGDALQIEIVDGPAHGRLTHHADGSYHYVPDADFNGEDHFTFRLNDGREASRLATVQLTVDPLDDLPQADDVTLTLAEDGSLAIDLARLGRDVDGDALHVELVVAPGHGRLVREADGRYRYTPDADFNGEDHFGYTVSDGHGTSNVGTVRLTITAVNDAAVALNDSATTQQGQPVRIDVLANDRDVDNAAGGLPANAGLTTRVVVQPLHGKLAANTDGSLTYTPDAGFYGADSFSYVANDGQADSVLASVAITVEAGNRAPVAKNASYTLQEDGSLKLDLRTLGSDPDGNALTPTIVANPKNGTLTRNADGSYTYVPKAHYNGNDSFTFTVSDGSLTSNIATVSLCIAAVNDAPVAKNASFTLQEDGSLKLDLRSLGSDAEGSTLTAAIVAQPKNGTLTRNADGTYTYVPKADYNGSDSFSYTVSDGSLVSNTATVSLAIAAVNDAPVAKNASFALAEDGSLKLDLRSLGSDAEGSALTAVIVAEPKNGTLTRNADGTYTYVPKADYNGSDSFTFTVNDGGLTSAVATVSLTINAVNDAPTARNASYTLAEDGSLKLEPKSLGSDVEGSALTAAIVAQPKNGTLTRNADGSYTYVPKADYSGSDSFTFTVSDGSLNSATATISLTVTAEADAPSLGLVDPANASRELFRTGWESAANVDRSSTLVQQAALDGWTLVTTPDATQGGQNGFEIWSNDDDMADPKVVMHRVKAATGNGVNWLELNNSTASQHQTLGTERKVETVAGASYTLSLDYAGRVGYTADISRISIYVDGVKIGSYEAASPASGLDWRAISFSFVGKGGSQVIRIVAEAPKPDSSGRGAMIDDIALTETLPANTGFEDSAIALSAIQAALRDTDGSEVLTVAIDALPVGTMLSDGSKTFTATAGNVRADVTGWNLAKLSLTPPKDFNGRFNLNVIATATEQANGKQASSAMQLAVTVRAVNDVPVAADDAATLAEDDSIVLKPLANDRDADGDALKLVVVNGPQHGKLTLNADGTVGYLADAHYSGADSFTYKLNDDRADSNVATVRLIIDAVADAPSLSLADPAKPARELFRTGWESAANVDRSSTLVQQAALDGWTLVTTPDATQGGQNGFEIWSNDDDMADPKVVMHRVKAAAGNGANWLELNNSTASQHQTLGIERKVETVAGASYTLSLDYAGRVGYTADISRIGIYVDGVKIGSYEAASPASGLDWRAISFSFVGKGGSQAIRIVAEAPKPDSSGRGAMIDDIALTETLPANTGLEDSAIQLSAIQAALRDTDGSETLTVTIDALPVGAVLTDGSKTFTATVGNTRADVTGWNLAKLSLTPPKDFNGRFNLNVIATATEKANGKQASSSATIVVTVLAVNDAPVAKNAGYSVAEDGSLKLDLKSLGSDADGDALTASIVAQPKNGTLTRNADGTFTYVPKANYAGSDSFTYTVNDGSASSATYAVNLTVTAVNDAPVALNAVYQLQRDGSVRIDFAKLVADLEGDALTLTLGKAAHGTLTRNADGSYTYRPAKGYSGLDGFSYMVSDGKASASGKITLSVLGGTSNCGGASLVVQSTASLKSGSSDQYGYLVYGSESSLGTVAAMTASTAGAGATVSWQGNVPTVLGGQTLGKLSGWDEAWLTELLGTTKQQSLAASTGLVVKVQK